MILLPPFLFSRRRNRLLLPSLDPGRPACPKCHHASGSSAFTLIELLVVIAIIAVLMSLIFAGFGKMRSSADTAKSASNLRQLYTAARSFSNDNQNLLPPITGLYPENFGGNSRYVGHLDSHGAKDVKVDPTLPDHVFGYGMNLNLSPVTTHWSIRGQGTGNWGGGTSPRFWNHSCYTWFDIPSPSKTILYAPTNSNPISNPQIVNYFAEYNRVSNADRHRKGFIQAVMADGSVQYLELEELTRQSPRSSFWQGGLESATTWN